MHALFPVSIIVAMRNASSTVIACLESVCKQKYPIKEIIVIDNASTDDSVILVNKFRGKHRDKIIRLIRHWKNLGVGQSFNTGLKAATSDFVVYLHADSFIQTDRELSRLTKPFRTQKGIVATYSHVFLPVEIWNKYPFWEKCHLANSVGKSIPGLNTKFDCYDKNVLLSIGGSDTVNYGHNIGIGSDDADLHYRLRKKGRVIPTRAKVVHLHYLNSDYSLNDWFENRKLYARSYGRIIRLHWRNIGPKGVLFAVRPALVLISFIPSFFPINVLIIFVYALLYMNKIYLDRTCRHNIRILLLPFLTIYLLYYETFWLIESMLYIPKKNRKL